MTVDPDRLEESLQRLTPRGDPAAGGAVAQLAQVVAAANDILDVDGVGVLLLDESGRLRAVAASGPAAAAAEVAQQHLGAGPGIDAVIARRTVVSNDLCADDRYAALPEVLGDGVVRGMISAPIRVATQVVGNLNAVARTPRPWSGAEVRAVEAFAAVISTILELSATGPAAEV
jgi:GAF domain-containing protein